MHKMIKNRKININQERIYRLELESVYAKAAAKVVEEEFGSKFQKSGGKIVFGDNDKKLHSDVQIKIARRKFCLSA